MAEQTLFVEDTVCLASDRRHIGVVDRTHANVETHEPDPRAFYTNGLDRGDKVPKRHWRAFLDTGIPPRGTVVVTWTYLPWQPELRASLVRERDVHLVDRALLVGDVVKRSARDAMSGTVVQSSARATLLQPLMWPAGRSTHAGAAPGFNDNLPSRLTNVLQDVPVDELQAWQDYALDDFVTYQGWVGEVKDMQSLPVIRLSNNTLVIPEDPSDLEHGSQNGQHHIGDWIRTRKANLRRGNWILGQYDADVEPQGWVADVRVYELGVDWLTSWLDSPDGGQMEPPPDVLDEQLPSGNVKAHDRRKPTAEPGARKCTWELLPSSRVRFKDLAAAEAKYSGADGHGKLERIPRQQSLGYDINVYCVLYTKTTLEVQWQDGSVTKDLPSLDCVPYLDLGVEDELWPGELVTTKVAETDELQGISRRTQVGVVQSINARDQVGKVRWMQNASFVHTLEQPPTLLPGSQTGPLHNDEQLVSLYDIQPVNGLDRRLGDIVGILHSHNSRHAPTAWHAGVLRAYELSSAPISATAWFGEVMELGLDGLLTVRCAGAGVSPAVDLKVPWECTQLIWSSDQDDDEEPADEWEELQDMWQDPALEQLLDEGGEARGPHERPAHAGVHADDDDDDDDGSGSAESWETEDDQDMDGEGHEWSDDGDDNGEDGDDDEDADENADLDGTASDEYLSAAEHRDANGDVVMGGTDSRPAPEAPAAPILQAAPAAHSNGEPSRPAFSYADMRFANPDDRPPPFAILDGTCPPCHHHDASPMRPAGKLLRRIQKEHRILASSLPEGAFVRTWEGSLDCLRVLLLGPVDTPYEYAPYVFDIYLDAEFPKSPPQVYFHSWTDGSGPCNPNLYENGTVCLSLLGTWAGNKGERWSADSTVLQIIVSLLGLVLVAEPYYSREGARRC